MHSQTAKRVAEKLSAAAGPSDQSTTLQGEDVGSVEAPAAKKKRILGDIEILTNRRTTLDWCDLERNWPGSNKWVASSRPFSGRFTARMSSWSQPAKACGSGMSRCARCTPNEATFRGSTNVQRWRKWQLLEGRVRSQLSPTKALDDFVRQLPDELRQQVTNGLEAIRAAAQLAHVVPPTPRQGHDPFGETLSEHLTEVDLMSDGCGPLHW